MNGCLIAVAIVFVLVVGGGLFIWINRDTIFTVISTGINEALELPKFELPEYGKQEYIDQEYGELLRTLDATAENGSSIMTFGAPIEGMTLPEEVLYIGINKGEDKTDVIKKFDWSGFSKRTVGGYGAGTLKKAGVSKDIIIYENEGPWNYMDSFVVYIEYTGGTEENPPE